MRAEAALDADLRVPDRDLHARCCASRTGVVPVGKVPSTGMALTGRRSPLPSIIIRVTRRTKSGSAAESRAAEHGASSDPLGDVDLVQGGQGPVHGREVPLEHRLAAPAVSLADRLLDVRDRLVAGEDLRQREEAGLHDRVDPPAQPGLAGDTERVDDVEPQLLVDDRLLDVRLGAATRPRRRCRERSAGTSPRAAAMSSTSVRSRKPHWWQATKLAWRIRYEERIGRGLNRRCETVVEPDFLES